MARRPEAIPYGETIARVLTAADAAVTELSDLLLDDDEAVRLKAAAELLRASTRAYELFELERRIAALEGKQGGPPAQEETDGDGTGGR